MVMQYLEPARTIIEKLGGIDAVAKGLGLDFTRPYRWMLPKSKGGTGGTIPVKHHQRLLDLADERGIDLEPSDFFVRAPRRRGRSMPAAAAA